MSDIEGFGRRTRGLSEMAFQEAYGREEQCRAALFEWRWGRGWSCPSCGHGGHCHLKKRAKPQCRRCKHRVSVTAGTIFHSTRLPPKVWFPAICHVSRGGVGMDDACPGGARSGGRRGRGAAGKTPFIAAAGPRSSAVRGESG